MLLTRSRTLLGASLTLLVRLLGKAFKLHHAVEYVLIDSSDSGATDKVGKTLGGLTGGKGKKGKGEGEGEGEDDGGSDEQLRLRLEINLDVEIQLKAKIHGDLTLGLLN